MNRDHAEITARDHATEITDRSHGSSLYAQSSSNDRARARVDDEETGNGIDWNAFENAWATHFGAPPRLTSAQRRQISALPVTPEILAEAIERAAARGVRKPVGYFLTVLAELAVHAEETPIPAIPGRLTSPRRLSFWRRDGFTPPTVVEALVNLTCRQLGADMNLVREAQRAVVPCWAEDPDGPEVERFDGLINTGRERGLARIAAGETTPAQAVADLVAMLTRPALVAGTEA
jgi:hypothetical protein